MEVIEPLRRTPAGIAVAATTLRHVSQQIEADVAREVSLELEAVAVGALAMLLAVAAPGSEVRVKGFLAAKSLRNRKPVLHLSEIEFVEGS